MYILFWGALNERGSTIKEKEEPDDFLYEGKRKCQSIPNWAPRTKRIQYNSVFSKPIAQAIQAFAFALHWCKQSTQNLVTLLQNSVLHNV